MTLYLKINLRENYLGEKSFAPTFKTIRFFNELYNGSGKDYSNSFNCREDLIKEYYYLTVGINKILPKAMGEGYDAFSEIGDVVESIEFGIRDLVLDKTQIENLDEFINKNLYLEHDQYQITENSIIMKSVFLFGATISLLILLMRNFNNLLHNQTSKKELADGIINSNALIGDEHLLTGLFIYLLPKECLTNYKDNGSYYGPADYASKMIYFYAGTEELDSFLKNYKNEIKPFIKFSSFWTLLCKEAYNGND